MRSFDVEEICFDAQFIYLTPQDLLRNKSRLEHDLAIKGNSLGIDRVSFSRWHSHYHSIIVTFNAIENGSSNVGKCGIDLVVSMRTSRGLM